MVYKGCRGFMSSSTAARTMERRAGSSIQKFVTCLNMDASVQSFLERVESRGGKALLHCCLELAEVEEEDQHGLTLAEGQKHEQAAAQPSPQRSTQRSMPSKWPVVMAVRGAE